LIFGSCTRNLWSKKLQQLFMACISQYDITLAQILKALRVSRGWCQSYIAQEINIDQSTYSRIERGESAVTAGQLKLIARLYHTSHFQLLALADHQAGDTNFRLTSFSELLVNIVELLTVGYRQEDLTESEIEFLVSVIRRKFQIPMKESEQIDS
jgi:transcriptional regulator with XRE-family HTH domain